MKTTSKNKGIYLAISYFRKIGPRALKRLEKCFPNLSDILIAGQTKLVNSGLSAAISTEFISWRKKFKVEEKYEELNNHQINFLTWHDKLYPPLLKEIYAPPPVIYYRGQIINAEKYLAVVGSRQTGAYGLKVISYLLPELISRGVVIVSGLARGADQAAHRTALDNQGITWAILGSGLDKNSIYPKENKILAQDIIDNRGAIISEFPPGTPPYRQNFPQRNRIIAGLSQASLIIEARKKSGALITANYALQENREVASVPGNIFSNLSDGPNRLIANGAKAIIEIEDLLEIFNFTKDNQSPNKPSFTKQISKPVAKNILKTDAAKIVYKLLTNASDRGERITVDEIIKKSALDTSVINSTLSILELAGIIKNDLIGYYLE